MKVESPVPGTVPNVAYLSNIPCADSNTCWVSASTAAGVGKSRSRTSTLANSKTSRYWPARSLRLPLSKYSRVPGKRRAGAGRVGTHAAAGRRQDADHYRGERQQHSLRHVLLRDVHCRLVAALFLLPPRPLLFVRR